MNHIVNFLMFSFKVGRRFVLSFFLVFTIASFVPTVWALGLPPKIETRSYSWLGNLKELTALKAVGLAITNTDPMLFRSASHLNGSFQNQGAFYLLQDSKILAKESAKSKQAVYSVELGFRPTLTREQGGVFSAWQSVGRAKFFVLNRFGTKAFRVDWSDDSQIVDVLPCGPTEKKYIVVENVNNGLTRFVFLDSDMKALGYTIFDLSQNAGVGDVATARVTPGKGCEEMTLQGAFGVAQVNYNPGSLR